MGRFKPGDFVSVEVPVGTTAESERTWVLVDGSDDERRPMLGKLDNEPIVPTGMRFEMELAVSYDNVRDHRTQGPFRQ